MPIILPIELGDVIRVGRFKNKKITVKEIGIDENNHPTVNGRGIMKIRIEKLMPPKEPKTENNMKKITESIDVSLPTIEKLYHGSGLNDKEAITLQTAYKKEVEDGKYPTGFNLKDVKTVMPNLLKKNLISLDNLKYAGVIRLTKSGQDFVKKINGIQESFKPNKAKLDRMITSMLKESFHSNDTQVKIKQKDKLWWIHQEETDECLNAVGFETKEQAEHSALTKGYSFSDQEEMNEMEPEILTTKKEKVKGVDKVEDMKLDKEKEIKLEILRIAKRVIKEELKKKIKINELEVTDPSIVKKIEEMARLSDEMDRLKNELAKLKKQFEPLDEEITTMIEEVAKTGDRALETKTILVTIKKMGNPAVEVAAYKERFEQLYSKVNGAMKKQSDEYWESVRTFKKIPTSIGVQYKKTEGKLNEESVLSRLVNKVKSFFSSIYNKIIQYGKVSDQGIAELHKLTGI